MQSRCNRIVVLVSFIAGILAAASVRGADPVARCKQANGFSGTGFVVCQTLPLDELQEVNGALTAMGHRPVCVRPWRDKDVVRIATIWHKDALPGRLETGLTAEQLAPRIETLRSEKFQLIDLASYADSSGTRFSAVWVRADKPVQVRMTANIDAAAHKAKADAYQEDKWFPSQLQWIDDGKGGRFTEIWSPGNGAEWTAWWGNPQFFRSKYGASATLTPLQTLSLTSTGGELALAGVWSGDRTQGDAVQFGTPAQVAEQSTPYIERGFRPVCVSATAVQDKDAVSAILWHRTRPQELLSAFDETRTARDLGKEGKFKEAITAAEHALAIIIKEEGSESLRVAHMQWDQAGWHRDLAEYEKALDLLRRAAITYRTIGGEASVDYTDVLLRVGNIYAAMGKHDLALREFETAIPLFKAVYGEESLKYAEFLGSVADHHRQHGDDETAIRLFLQALPAHEKLKGPKDPDTVGIVRGLGFALIDAQRFKEAEPVWRRIIAELADDDVNWIPAMRGFAHLLHKVGKLRESADGFQNILARVKPDAPEREGVLDGLVTVCREAEDMMRGLPACEELQRIRTQRGGAESADFARGLRDLSVFQRLGGRTEEAKHSLREALRIRRKLGEGGGDSAMLAAVSLFRLLLDSAQFDEGERLLAELRAGIDVQTPSGLRRDVAVRRMEGQLWMRKQEPARALELFQTAAQEESQLTGASSEPYADVLREIAQAQRSLRQFVLAEKTQDTAVKIYQSILGETNPAYSNALDELAQIQFDGEAYDRFESTCRIRLALMERLHGERHPLTAKAVEELANSLATQLKLSASIALFERAAVIREAVLPETDLARLDGLLRLANIYFVARDLPKALPLFERHLRQIEPLRDTEPLRYLNSLLAVGATYYSLGRLPEAEVKFIAARDFAVKKFPNSADHARCLIRLADVHRSRRESVKAEELLLAAHAMMRKKSGVESADFKESLNALALFYDGLGDKAKAQAYRNQFPDLKSTNAPRREIDESAIRFLQAAELISKGDYARALPLAEHAVEATRLQLGEESTSFVSSLSFLGKCQVGLREYALAERTTKRSVELSAKVFGPESEMHGIALMDLAHVHMSLGEDRESVALLDEALTKFQRGRIVNHGLVASCQGRLGMLYLVVGNAVSAKRVLQSSLTSRLETLRLVLPGLSSGEALAVLGQSDFWTVRDGLIQAQGHTAGTEAEACQNLWNTRSLLLKDLESRRLRVFESAEAQQVFGQLQQKRRELSEVALATVDEKQAAAHQERLAQLNDEKETLEKSLAKASAAFARQQRSSPTVADLRKLLPADMAVIEIVRESRFATAEPGRSLIFTPVAHYEAFVMCASKTGEATVVRVPLGIASELDPLIEQWLSIVSRPPAVPSSQPMPADVGGTSRAAPPAEILRDKVWKPIERELRGLKRVAVVPEGLFARVPWVALPGAKPGTLLLDEGYGFVTAANGERVAEILSTKPSTLEQASILLVGGVEFGSVETGSTSNGWGPLPKTLTEVEVISGLWKKKGSVRVLSGGKADKQSVLAQLAKSGVAHLATHGYFADASGGAPVSNPSGAVLAFRGGPFVTGGAGAVGLRNPLLASGLVFAGANRSSAGGLGEAVLTAEEVAGADLRTLRLVTLSACESALGRTDRESVFGLQTAFQMAGVPTVTAALWQVEDEATQALMVEFYKNLLEKRLGTLESLRRAQLRIRQDFDARTLTLRGVGGTRPVATPPSSNPVASADPSDPFFWAAFSLSGDWR